MKIGELIRHQREQLGMTQEGLAKKLCVSISYVSDWERKNRAVPGKWVPNLSAAHDLTEPAIRAAMARSKGAVELPISDALGYRDILALDLLTQWDQLTTGQIESLLYHLSEPIMGTPTSLTRTRFFHGMAKRCGTRER